MKQLHIKSGTYERIAIEILDNADVGVPYLTHTFFVEQDNDVIYVEISLFLYWTRVVDNYKYGLPVDVLTDVVVNWHNVFTDFDRPTDFEIEKLIKRLVQ